MTKNMSKHQSKRYRGLKLTNTEEDNKADAIDICPCINGKLDYNATDDLFFIIGLFFAEAKELNDHYYNNDFLRGFGAKEPNDNQLLIRTGALWNYNSIKENREKGFVDGYHVELV